MTLVDSGKRISSHLETDFEKRFFTAILQQIERSNDPLRASNFAYSLRELSRHVLHRLAPDIEVKAAPWFVQEKNERGIDIITRYQRIKFAIQGHFEDEFVSETLEVDYEAETKALKKAIDNLSKYTHVEPETFNLSEQEVSKLCSGAMDSLNEMFDAMFDCRERTLEAVAQHVDDAVISHVVEETLEGFHDFATHYSIDEVMVENLTCTGFKDDEIFGRVDGSVSVTLLYGSASDREKGDGAEADASANFSCNVIVQANDLSSVSIEEDSFEMDFSELEESWTDDGSTEF